MASQFFGTAQLAAKIFTTIADEQFDALSFAFNCAKPFIDLLKTLQSVPRRSLIDNPLIPLSPPPAEQHLTAVIVIERLN